MSCFVCVMVGLSSVALFALRSTFASGFMSIKVPAASATAAASSSFTLLLVGDLLETIIIAILLSFTSLFTMIEVMLTAFPSIAVVGVGSLALLFTFMMLLLTLDVLFTRRLGFVNNDLLFNELFVILELLVGLSVLFILLAKETSEVELRAFLWSLRLLLFSSNFLWLVFWLLAEAIELVLGAGSFSWSAQLANGSSNCCLGLKSFTSLLSIAKFGEVTLVTNML